MLKFPNCKINIGLYVTGKREDGYHNLETIFYPFPLRDVVEIIPAQGEESLHLSGKTIEGANERENIVWKAYELMRQHFPDRVPAMDIYLHKLVPMGAGLGGGSADGSCILKMINEQCNLGLNDEELAELALLLGSDCPFFVYNTPQYASGRGEQMEPVELDLSAYSIQLICPRVHISTGKAFQLLTPTQAPFDLRTLPQLPVDQWKETISNDFEQPVFHMHPELKHIKEQLYDQGALFASMSGSGSSIFGIFSKGKRGLIKTDIIFEEFYMEAV